MNQIYICMCEYILHFSNKLFGLFNSIVHSKRTISYFYAPAIRRIVEQHKVLPLSVRPSVRPSVRYQNLCPLNNFWKTASIQFKFGMLIYNINTQVEFDLGYNPLIFDRVMGLL